MLLTSLCIILIWLCPMQVWHWFPRNCYFILLEKGDSSELCCLATALLCLLEHLSLSPFCLLEHLFLAPFEFCLLELVLLPLDFSWLFEHLSLILPDFSYCLNFTVYWNTVFLPLDCWTYWSKFFKPPWLLCLLEHLSYAHFIVLFIKTPF